MTEINCCIARDLLGCCLLPSSPWMPMQPRRVYPTRPTARSRWARAPCQDSNPSALRPLWDEAAGSAATCTLRGLVSNVVTHRAFKLLTCRYLPQGLAPLENSQRLSPYTYPSLLRRLERMFARADTLDLHSPPSPATPSSHRQRQYAEVQQREKSSPKLAEISHGMQPNAAVAAQLCMRGPAVRALQSDPMANCSIGLWRCAASPPQVCSKSLMLVLLQA